MTAVRHLVVVARPDPSTADEMADILRDAFTVRTAYTTTGMLDRLDSAVDVVLVDPDLPGDVVGAVRDAIADRDLDCQVGLVAVDPADERTVDAVVPPTASGREVRDRVGELATRACYRKTLEKYYDLARTSAELGDTDGVQTERDRLRNRLERLERRLDEVARPLDTTALFQAALGPDQAGHDADREDGSVD